MRLDFLRHDAAVRAVFVVDEMRLGLVARVADQPVSGAAPFLIAHFRAAVAAHEQPGQQLSAVGGARPVGAVQAALRAQPCLAVDERLMGGRDSASPLYRITPVLLSRSRICRTRCS